MTIDTFILTGVGSGKVDAGRAKRWWVGGASAFQLAVVLAQLPFTPAEAEEVGTKSDRVWSSHSMARSSQVPQRSVNPLKWHATIRDLYAGNTPYMGTLGQSPKNLQGSYIVCWSPRAKACLTFMCAKHCTCPCFMHKTRTFSLL